MFLLLPETHTSPGVSRSLQYLQFVVAKGDLLIFLEEMSYRRILYVEVHVVELAGLLYYAIHQVLVAFRHLHLQFEGIIYGIVAKEVVQVSVCGKQVLGLQSVVVDIADYGLSLFGVERSTVNDDTLLCLVAHHIAVLL